MVEAAAAAVVVREYDGESERDRGGVEEVERACEVGSSGAGKMCLFTDLLGDPLCRIRNSPAYLMLVAETATGGGEANGTEIAGLVRGCVKSVVSSSTQTRDPIYTKVGYILGLRVSPSHRRKGVGKKLVDRMEEWFRQMRAEYSYMATEQDNEASVRLFTSRCGYAKFRTPSVLVHPVFGHALEPSRSSAIVPLEPREAELLYRWHFAAVEFFPADIDAVLFNALSLGTFLAVPAGARWEGVEAFLAAPPASWAVLSVWNCMNAFRLEVRGAPRLMRAAAGATRLVDRAAPWLKIPSIPNLFAPFGLYFLYGLGGAGPDAPRLARALCRHAHNMARSGGCGVVATEVGACEPVRAGVPHWARLGAEDLWCIKRLADGYSDGPLGDWTKAPAGHSIFIDPREF
ncbi:probable N-acetyltransferase HLS1-like [Phragmites australis]|uniref:probable N-acetyltransferase HLS1-like n=1 Tax=Phragmites australis TaxID=29695 RepID=UPI002D7A27CB|nr:probable N-acetyltransferase HLS1-like [Phragmites australis]